MTHPPASDPALGSVSPKEPKHFPDNTSSKNSLFFSTGAGGCVTVAEKDGDDYILNGLKCFNTNGPLADSQRFMH